MEEAEGMEEAEKSSEWPNKAPGPRTQVAEHVAVSRAVRGVLLHMVYRV